MGIISKRVKYLSALAPSRNYSVPLTDWLNVQSDNNAMQCILESDGSILSIGVGALRYMTVRRQDGDWLLEIVQTDGNILNLLIDVSNPVAASALELSQLSASTSADSGAVVCVDELAYASTDSEVQSNPPSIYDIDYHEAWALVLAPFLPVKIVNGYWALTIKEVSSYTYDPTLIPSDLRKSWSPVYSLSLAGDRNLIEAIPSTNAYVAREPAPPYTSDLKYEVRTYYIFVNANDVITNLEIVSQVNGGFKVVDTKTQTACFTPFA